MGGQFDLLVAPLGRPELAGDQAHPVDPPEVAVDERVAASSRRRPFGQPEMPRGVVLPGMGREEPVSSSARGASPVSRGRTGDRSAPAFHGRLVKACREGSIGRRIARVHGPGGQPAPRPVSWPDDRPRAPALRRCRPSPHPLESVSSAWAASAGRRQPSYRRLLGEVIDSRLPGAVRSRRRLRGFGAWTLPGRRACHGATAATRIRAPALESLGHGRPLAAIQVCLVRRHVDPLDDA